MNKNKIRFGLKTLRVKYHERYVGTLAMTAGGRVAFSYDESWIDEGFSISPFSLPLERKVYVPSKDCFEGMFGIFADSLPDAWGRLLLDKMLKEHDLNKNITVLDRLALIGSSGMGALEYEPDYSSMDNVDIRSLDQISQECKKLLNAEYSDKLDELYSLGGSSGGARPKIMTQLEGKEWIIKFPAHTDYLDIGEQEYIYSLCAKKCGIDMTETRLFPSESCKGYFGTVRFDREFNNGTMKKIHMATAAALLEADFRAPCLDYNALMKLTRILTRENISDVENMFRRACFNVFAHNQDDHAKNFSFLYDEEADHWRLSPAYDITYSNTYWGEHTTSVDGNGADPGEKELMNVGKNAGLRKSVCIQIIEEVRDNVRLNLHKKENFTESTEK